MLHKFYFLKNLRIHLTKRETKGKIRFREYLLTWGYFPRNQLANLQNCYSFSTLQFKLAVSIFEMTLYPNYLYLLPTGGSEGSWDEKTLYSSSPQGCQASVAHPHMPGACGLPLSHPFHHLQQSHLLLNGTMAFFSSKLSGYKEKHLIISY